MSKDELKQLRMRGPEPDEWFSYIESGGAIYPLSVFAREIDPVDRVGQSRKPSLFSLFKK